MFVERSNSRNVSLRRSENVNPTHIALLTELEHEIDVSAINITSLTGQGDWQRDAPQRLLKEFEDIFVIKCNVRLPQQT
jgi:hypothetical protein